jgi:hypothetical protein
MSVRKNPFEREANMASLRLPPFPLFKEFIAPTAFVKCLAPTNASSTKRLPAAVKVTPV